MSSDSLLDVLCARHGIVCAVGAGGKKTTLYRLLQAHPGHAGFTTTVFTRMWPEDLPAHSVVADPQTIVDEVVAQAANHGKLAYACPSTKPQRYGGLAPKQVVECHARGKFDVTFVKADGARMRLLKAPAEHEPNLVLDADTVLGLVSARVIGLPLSDRNTHRLERVARITGAQAREKLTPLHIARLIASPEGLSRNIGDAQFIPVISMADNPRCRKAGAETARIALDMGAPCERIVVAAMRENDPVVAVVTR